MLRLWPFCSLTRKKGNAIVTGTRSTQEKMVCAGVWSPESFWWEESLLAADCRPSWASLGCRSFARCSLRCNSYPNSGWKTRCLTSATISNCSHPWVNPLAPLWERNTSSQPASPSSKPCRVHTCPTPTPHLQIARLRRAFLHPRRVTNTLKLCFMPTPTKPSAPTVLGWLKSKRICQVVTL